MFPFQFLEEYEILGIIGVGGYSKVYKVRHKKFDIIFATKVIELPEDENPSFLDSYINEINALKKLDHINVIKLYSHFQFQNFLYLVLEYCENGTLVDYLNDIDRNDYNLLTNICRQIVSALFYCHSQCIAHRDIKPSNILIDKFKRPKLSDFGLSIEINSRNKIINSNCSIYFAAPEVLRRLSHSPFEADVWSLGVVFFYLFTCEIPWNLSSPENTKESILLGLYSIPNIDHPIITYLVKNMILVNPLKRIKIINILNHEIFENNKENNLNIKIQRKVLSKKIPSTISLAKVRSYSKILSPMISKIEYK